MNLLKSPRTCVYKCNIFLQNDIQILSLIEHNVHFTLKLHVNVYWGGGGGNTMEIRIKHALIKMIKT